MQQPQTLSLPAPDAESAMHSERVAEFIRDRIRDAGGQISFAEYMHHCLYAPGLGYYDAGSAKFGGAGDFVTAPEISSLFGTILARQCAEVLAQLESPAILEIGAGSGKLAADILKDLAELGAVPENGYKILDVSADLRERQESLLRRDVPELVDSIEWLDALPEDFSGVVIANEVLDALPVERFVRRENGTAQVASSQTVTASPWSRARRRACLPQRSRKLRHSSGRVCPTATPPKCASRHRNGLQISAQRCAMGLRSCSTTAQAAANTMRRIDREVGYAVIFAITRMTIR